MPITVPLEWVVFFCVISFIIGGAVTGLILISLSLREQRKAEGMNIPKPKTPPVFLADYCGSCGYYRLDLNGKYHARCPHCNDYTPF